MLNNFIFPPQYFGFWVIMTGYSVPLLFPESEDSEELRVFERFFLFFVFFLELMRGFLTHVCFRALNSLEELGSLLFFTIFLVMDFF